MRFRACQQHALAVRRQRLGKIGFARGIEVGLCTTRLIQAAMAGAVAPILSAQCSVPTTGTPNRLAACASAAQRPTRASVSTMAGSSLACISTTSHIDSRTPKTATFTPILEFCRVHHWVLVLQCTRCDFY